MFGKYAKNENKIISLLSIILVLLLSSCTAAKMMGGQKPHYSVDMIDVERGGDANEVKKVDKMISKKDKFVTYYEDNKVNMGDVVFSDDLMEFRFRQKGILDYYIVGVKNKSESKFSINWSEVRFMPEGRKEGGVIIDGLSIKNTWPIEIKKGSPTKKYKPGEFKEVALLPNQQFLIGNEANYGPKYGPDKAAKIECLKRSSDEEFYSYQSKWNRLAMHYNYDGYEFIEQEKLSSCWAIGKNRIKIHSTFDASKVENIQGKDFRIKIPINVGNKSAVYTFTFEVREYLGLR